MDKKYSGMTVNERLYISGLYDKFYKAIEEKDIQQVIEIIKNVELKDDSTINPILAQFGLRPN